MTQQSWAWRYWRDPVNAYWQACFLICMACVIYPYIVYPLILAVLAVVCRRPVQRARGPLPSVSVVISAYNEEAAIKARLDELTWLLGKAGAEAELIVVSDGSTDHTAAIVRNYPSDLVRLIDLEVNEGKAEALSRGCAAAGNDILVFADARQSWAEDSLALLLENFADPNVGAASGDLIIDSSPGCRPNDVSLYWRYEKILRRLESGFASSVGVTGSICAVRRGLFRPIPRGTILDDVYWPLQVALLGYRVVHDWRVRAHDYLPKSQRQEFRRKLRTLSGNFQLLRRLPEAFLPWCNPVWYQLMSHKVARLVVPWALLGALLSSAALMDHPVYRTALHTQMALYAVGVAGLVGSIRAHFRLASVAASFAMLNAAAWLAFWVWISGRASKTWQKVQYAQEIGQVHSLSRGV
jgi:poly-beta-1,6-N-acetyl-D-glucosamine synthase